MLDSVEHQMAPCFTMPPERTGGEADRPELVLLLARQTHALEYIASRLGVLTGDTLEIPPELQPDFEIARRRLLEETV